MRYKASRLVTSCIALSVAMKLAGAAAQKSDSNTAGTPPGPEHAAFSQVAGTWDATVQSWMAPGSPSAMSRGVETSRVGCRGQCLITDFQASMMGAPYSAHGVETYDSRKKKYVGTWMDSMSTGLSVTEGNYDAATKTMVGTIQGPDSTGENTVMRSVWTMKDPNTREFSMYSLDPDGREVLMLRIDYKKRTEVPPPTPMPTEIPSPKD